VIFERGRRAATEACYAAAWVVVACVFGIMMLLVHHKLEHSDRARPERYVEDPCEQWFQRSDACNWRAWNHETFIIALFVLAVAACVFIRAWGCV
jgi:hypothetical protein